MENSKKPEKKASFFSFLEKKPKNDTPLPDTSKPDDMVIEKVEENKYFKPLPEIRPSEKMLENIVSRKTDRDLPNLILGPKPAKSAPDIIQFGVTKKLKAAQTFLQIVVVLSLLSFAFFKIELDDTFHLFEKYLGFPTLANELTNLSKTIVTSQTEINFYNTALSKFHLDKFVYLYNYWGAVPEKDEDLKELQESLAIIQAKAHASLYANNVPSLYNHLSLPVMAEGTPPPIETYLADTYKEALLTFINQQKDSLQQRLSADENDESYLEIKILESLPILVEKRTFMDTMLSEYDPDTLNISSVKKLVKQFNDISKNEYAVISAIKDSRIGWTANLINVANITKKVDFYFGEPGATDLAKIFYTSYSFDADKNMITVHGDIRTDNVMVFSELISLIEAFETAPEFKLINELRKFEKSEQDDKYVSSFQFDLFINPPLEIPEETPLEVPVEAPVETKVTTPVEISTDTPAVQTESEESSLPILEKPEDALPHNEESSDTTPLPEIEKPLPAPSPAPRT